MRFPLKIQYLVISVMLISFVEWQQLYSQAEVNWSDSINACQDSLMALSFFEMRAALEKRIDDSNQEIEKVHVRELLIFRYYLEGNTDSLEQVTHRAMNLAWDKGFYNEYFSSWSYLLNHYIMIGWVETAIRGAEEMRNQAIEHNLTTGVATSVNILGDIYLSMDLYDEALDYYKEAMAIYKKGNNEIVNISSICAVGFYINVTNIYRKQYDEVFAISNMIDSLVNIIHEADPTPSDDAYRLVSMCSRVIAYSKLGRLEEAKECFDKMEEYFLLSQTQKDYYLEAKAVYYEENGRILDAIQTMEEIIHYYKEMGLTKEMLKFYKEMARLNDIRGDSKSAYDNLKFYSALRDSLNDAQTLSQVNEYAILNNLQIVEAEKNELAIEVEVVKKKQMFAIVLFLVLLLLVSIFFFLRQYQTNVRLRESEHNLNKEKEALLESGARLRDALEKAQESDRLKTAFLANMSHEIRTQLNAIVGFSDMLSSETDDEQREFFKRLIKTNSILLLCLIEDIIELSKVDAGIVNDYQSEFDVVQLFKEMKEQNMAHAASLQKNITFELDTNYKSLVVEMNKMKLSKIMKNLLINAMKFTEKGEIHIGLECEREGLRAYVTDTGIGIEQEDIGKIFERYYKVDNFSQGTGLGLSLCKAYVEACKGEIGVRSQKGEGSTFWIWLPCKIKKKEYYSD